MLKLQSCRPVSLARRHLPVNGCMRTAVCSAGGHPGIGCLLASTAIVAWNCWSRALCVATGLARLTMMIYSIFSAHAAAARHRRSDWHLDLPWGLVTCTGTCRRKIFPLGCATASRLVPLPLFLFSQDEKRIIYNHNIDQKGYKWSDDTRLKKIENNLLPQYINENIEKYKDWLD